jgi:hypothetical protein
MFLTALSYILEEYTLIYMVINYLIFSFIFFVFCFQFSSQGSIPKSPAGGDIPSDGTLDEISAKIYRKDLERLANKLGLVKDDIDEIRDIYNERKDQVINNHIY